MGFDSGDRIEQLIEAHLSGRLSPTERATLEQRLELEPGLRAEIEAQRLIDEALRSTFEPPSLVGLWQQAVARAAKPPARVPFSRRPLRQRLRVEVAIAAVLGLVIGGGYVAWQSYGERRTGTAVLARQSMLEFYQERVGRGWEPDWVCDEQRFRYTFSYRLGQPVLMATAPGVSMTGLAYSNTLSPNTVNVLAKVDGSCVMIYADRVPADAGQGAGIGRDLNVFERRLGSLVFYELTPLKEPRVLDLLYVPDAESSQPAA